MIWLCLFTSPFLPSKHSHICLSTLHQIHGLFFTNSYCVNICVYIYTYITIPELLIDNTPQMAPGPAVSPAFSPSTQCDFYRCYLLTCFFHDEGSKCYPYADTKHYELSFLKSHFWIFGGIDIRIVLKTVVYVWCALISNSSWHYTHLWPIFSSFLA